MGVRRGTIIRVIKGDTRSLDHGSDGPFPSQETPDICAGFHENPVPVSAVLIITIRDDTILRFRKRGSLLMGICFWLPRTSWALKSMV